MSTSSILGSVSDQTNSFTHIVVGKWVDTASVVLFVYECLITMDMEVQLVWKSDWKFAKVLYILNRYMVIADILILYLHSYGIRIPACKALLYAAAAFYVVGLYISECILILRVGVVWRTFLAKKNMVVIAILAAIYTGSVIYMLVSFYLMLRPLEFFTLLPFSGCLTHTGKASLWIDYALLLIYDAIMLSLMAYPTIRAYVLPYQQTDLMRHVHAEGVLFYVYLFLVDIVSVTIQLAVPDDIFIFVMPGRVMRSILAARVVLHIREFSTRTEFSGSSNVELSYLKFR